MTALTQLGGEWLTRQTVAPWKRQAPEEAWHVLIVDQEAEVHQATTRALHGMRIRDRALKFLHAYSSQQAQVVLAANTNVAVVIVDVAIETEASALAVVSHLRDELKRMDTRIILRTAQNYAPPIDIIQAYDIHDYRTRAELTRTRLTTTIASAIRSYEQICAIEATCAGLNKVAAAAADLYARRGVADFAEGVLKQAAALIGAEPHGLLCAAQTTPFDIAVSETLFVVGACGNYSGYLGKPITQIGDARIAQVMGRAIAEARNLFERDCLVLFFREHSDHHAVAFLEINGPLGESDRRLLSLFGGNVATGFENVTLFDKLHTYAYYDQLCGLPNRIKFVNMVDEQILKQRTGWVVGIVDVDHFSETNDALGHDSGDLLLRSIVARLKSAVSEDVVIARVAGDVFGVLAREPLVDPEQILLLFDSPFAVDGYELQVSASMGLVRLAESSGSGLDALKNGSIALKRAKGRQRGRYHYYTPQMEAETRERVKLCHDLRHYIEKQKLKLYFQPQISLRTGRPVGAEALLRWQTPDGSFVPPDKFIPIAEYSGLVMPLGEWVLRTAARQLRLWNDQGLRDFRVAVNVSMSQFRSLRFTSFVADVIQEFRVDPEMVELEITESMAMEDVEVVIQTLQRLKAIGVAVAIDDFGTGFSSLGYLQKLKVDRLKIDRTFVGELVHATQRASISEMIIKLGHSLGLRVIGEGVETKEQADRLRALACDEAQGYYYSRPTDIKSFEAWLGNRDLLKFPTTA